MMLRLPRTPRPTQAFPAVHRHPGHARSALLAALLLAAPVAVRAQVPAVVDEGTFMVSRNGAPVGREAFRIVRAAAPGGQAFRATGQSALGSARFTTSLGTDSLGVPVTYESELSQGGTVVQRLKGRGGPGRFSVLVQTPNGEAAREYLLNNGALLIDDDVIHQFYFVPMATVRRELIVITPRSGQQSRYRVEERPNETVEVAGRTVPSRRYTLTVSGGGATGGGGAPREVWTDERGRLLKVVIPDKGITALRDDLPR